MASQMRKGRGSMFTSLHSLHVTGAISRIVVTLSRNADRTAVTMHSKNSSRVLLLNTTHTHTDTHIQCRQCTLRAPHSRARQHFACAQGLRGHSLAARELAGEHACPLEDAGAHGNADDEHHAPQQTQRAVVHPRCTPPHTLVSELRRTRPRTLPTTHSLPPPSCLLFHLFCRTHTPLRHPPNNSPSGARHRASMRARDGPTVLESEGTRFWMPSVIMHMDAPIMAAIVRCSTCARQTASPTRVCAACVLFLGAG
eukprot:3204471-Rhodomonas_salina.1